ncbi:MAG: SGNH/GDSL hydrolase family protein [Pirellulaceae bacterium]
MSPFSRRHFLQTTLAAALLAAPAFAQDKKNQDKKNQGKKNQDQKKKKRAERPEFQPVEDVAGLPRVLLIGDSISIGYHLAVREALAGKANVHRPPTNCGPTTTGVEQIDTWLGEGKWDVIHFNFGLHDLKYVNDQGQNVDPSKGHPQVSLANYEKNLESLVARLKKTGAKLIFATTTPVPEGSSARRFGDERKYNDAALAVMKQHGVAIDDLHALALPKLKEIQLPANVHFKPAGSKLLGQQVAEEISKALGS